ncbi:MAG: hypothetical protein PHS32_19995 [Rhodoferax sp.]|uniref:hypothetical protein n=1 Tax=Rhodoferax sp. TaxID=50421 RepID=UPI002621DB6D|nr:hypothetical protein [Rhodoferax sp.]MDD5336023.1 hypothetical protein [Rhodoferax sp.]
MHPSDISSDPVDPNPAIRRFAHAWSAGPIGLAKLLPEVSALHTSCLANVQAKVERDGGQITYGWTFLLRFAPDFGHYLVATHHAVWHSSRDMSLVDVTPFHPESRHQPITQRGDTLFLVDQCAHPARVGNVVSPLPSRFFPVDPGPAIDSYLVELARKEEQECRDHVERLLRTQGRDGDAYKPIDTERQLQEAVSPRVLSSGQFQR